MSPRPSRGDNCETSLTPPGIGQEGQPARLAPAPSLSATTRLRLVFFFSSRRRHTRLQGDWSSDVCSSDLILVAQRHAEESITDLLGMALRYEGFDVQVAHTARQALRAVTDRRPHLLILDVKIGRASCRERV